MKLDISSVEGFLSCKFLVRARVVVVVVVVSDKVVAKCSVCSSISISRSNVSLCYVSLGLYLYKLLAV